MKRHGHILEQITDFKNLLSAYKRASKGKKDIAHVQKFYFYLEHHIIDIQKELRTCTYQMLPYTTFTIQDPKKREIAAPKFRDHVVGHAIHRVIYPLLDRRFIYDSYASRTEKGLHKAIQRTQKFAYQSSHFLKIDINNYFATVDHQILLQIMQKYFKDKPFLEIIKTILANPVPHHLEGKGLALGNILSQIFANVYLNPFDHLIETKTKHYIRYLDDMIFFADDKEQLQELHLWIKGYFHNELRLEIKDKITILSQTHRGIPFLGFLIFPSHIRLRNNTLRRARKKFNNIEKQFLKGEISELELQQHTNGLMEHLKIANTYKLRQIWLANSNIEDII